MNESHELRILDLPCGRSAPSLARSALSEMHGVSARWPLDDALTVTSELVTNAVFHSGGNEHDRVHVRMAAQRDGIEISVSESSDPQARVHRDPGAGVWGLVIVDRLAARWGTQRRGRYCVWAQLGHRPSRTPSHWRRSYEANDNVEPMAAPPERSSPPVTTRRFNLERQVVRILRSLRKDGGPVYARPGLGASSPGSGVASSRSVALAAAVGAEPRTVSDASRAASNRSS